MGRKYHIIVARQRQGDLYASVTQQREAVAYVRDHLARRDTMAVEVCRDVALTEARRLGLDCLADLKMSLLHHIMIALQDQRRGNDFAGKYVAVYEERYRLLCDAVG